MKKIKEQKLYRPYTEEQIMELGMTMTSLECDPSPDAPHRSDEMFRLLKKRGYAVWWDEFSGCIFIN